MSVRYEPPWAGRVPSARRPSFPAFRGDATPDVVIVGAGLTGCATAYACAAAGLQPVVLEADRVAMGGTGFGAGLILPAPQVPFRDVVGAHGLRAGKLTFGAWRRGALDAAALLKRLSIRCDLAPVDVISVVDDGDDVRELRKDFDARQHAGIDVRWLTERQVRAVTRSEDVAGLGQPGAFAFDPYRAALGLALAATKKGATFHEASPVTRIRHARAHVDVVTARGTLRAKTVVLANGSPGALFPPLRRHFVPHDVFHVLTEEIPAPVRRQVVGPDLALRSTRHARSLVRMTTDHRFLVAGAARRAAKESARDRLLHQWTFELMYELLKKYPSISGIQPTNGWIQGSSVTWDGLPFIGPHRNYPHHLFAWGGSAGESATGAFLAARLLVRALTGKPETSDAAFGFTR